MTREDPRQILGVGPHATDREIRDAYLRGIRNHPPERDPEQFERIRDAYDRLRDPRRRTHDLLFADPVPIHLDQLLDGARARRRFVGPKAWLAALKQR